MAPGSTYTLSIQIEHPAANGHAAYVARTDVTLQSPVAVKEPQCIDNTAPYLPQTRVSNLSYDHVERPDVQRSLDRWGNVTKITDPRVLAAGRHWSTSYAYNANNQLVRQSQELDTSAPDANGQLVNQAVTEVFYDKLGQQVAVKDALGHVNAMVFDAGGKLMAERHADGGRTDYGYNAFGEQTQSTLLLNSGNNVVVTNNKYDKLGHLLVLSTCPPHPRHAPTGSFLQDSDLIKFKNFLKAARSSAWSNLICLLFEHFPASSRVQFHRMRTVLNPCVCTPSLFTANIERGSPPASRPKPEPIAPACGRGHAARRPDTCLAKLQGASIHPSFDAAERGCKSGRIRPARFAGPPR